MSNPSDLQYTADHEWLKRDGEAATVGVTAYAVGALGDVVYLDLPEVGTAITAGTPCGEIESTKSVSELFAPVNGTVTAINDAVVDDPALVNSDPFGDGWLFTVQISGEPELLDAAAYAELTGEDG